MVTRKSGVITRQPQQDPRTPAQLPGQVSDLPCVDCLDQPPLTGRARQTAPARIGFWLVALILTATMLGTTLPTPLYVIYQAQWHFSAGVVTVTFAVYAAAVMATLLLAGHSSDQAGRKPVLAAALGASALSTVVFIVAPDVGVLFIGRILSGLSAGLMTGTATATLTELSRPGRRASVVATAANMFGLGLGPLVAGLFAQYLPHPTVLVFEVYLGVLAAVGGCLLLVPEPVLSRRRPVLRFTGLSIPSPGRGEFIAAATAGFAAFSLIGLFAALAPTFLGTDLHQTSHAVQGAVVFLLLGVGTATQLLLARLRSRRVMMGGLGLLLAALALIVAALAQASMALFLTGTVIGGTAVGAVFLGSLATANRMTSPERRGQTISTYFVACYCGLIIPVIGVGVASGFVGDLPAVLAFSILLAALCLYSLEHIRRVSLCGPVAARTTFPPLLYLQQQLVGRNEERVLMDQAADNYDRMRPQGIHHHARAKFDEVVRADDPVLVFGNHIIEPRLELEQVDVLPSPAQCPFHMRHESCVCVPCRRPQLERLLECRHPRVRVQADVAERAVLPRPHLQLAGAHSLAHIDTIFNEWPEDPALLVNAVEERTDMTPGDRDDLGGLRRLRGGCHNLTFALWTAVSSLPPGWRQPRPSLAVRSRRPGRRPATR
jgi:MFS family permease